MTTVAILGGGIGGLSAAHMLLDRGFEVTVYEKSSIAGGKARSVGKPKSGVGGRPDLPGEHGFRFIPGFYRHLPETMSEIPFGPGSVADNLVRAKKIQLACTGGKEEILARTKFPTTLRELIQAFEAFRKFYCDMGISKREVTFFVQKLVDLMTSCTDRRFCEFESQSWWSYVDANNKTQAYQQYLANSLSRSLVAADPKKMSARTGGYLLLQFLFDFTRGGKQLDRVLNAPTNEAWIEPWVKFLQLNKDFHYYRGVNVERINCSGKRITGVRVNRESTSEEITADYYVAALPIEVMRGLITQPMIDADPQLGELHRLVTEWMTGIMFYLKDDVTIVRGHSNYVDSQWALTSISQQQFWPHTKVRDHGDGRAKGLLSVIISNWDAIGICGKTAKQCDEVELVNEVWNQLKEHLNGGAAPVLQNGNRVGHFIAPSMQRNGGVWSNDEPLLINEAGSWQYRPTAALQIENLMLAADYVRTNSDLACMESANEAARAATNAIIQRSGAMAHECDIYSYDEPFILAPFQMRDSHIRFPQQRPARQIRVHHLAFPCYRFYLPYSHLGLGFDELEHQEFGSELDR